MFTRHCLGAGGLQLPMTNKQTKVLLKKKPTEEILIILALQTDRAKDMIIELKNRLYKNNIAGQKNF